MRLKYNFIVKKIGEAQVAVPVGDDAAKFNGMVKLNSTAAVIFEKLKNETTIGEIVDTLTEKYGITRDEAESATKSYLDSLRKSGLIAE